MEKIIAEIKKKKELSDIPDSLVHEVLNNYLKKYHLNPPSEKKQLNLLIKEIRSQLRRYTGQYQSKSYSKKLKLLKENKIQELLKTHSSTRERLPHYEKIKKLISSFFPSSILDLGCGINPIAISQKGIHFHCYDIKSDDLSLISNFFKKNKIKHKTHHKDITKISEFPKTDICLIFKTLDLLDSKGHKNTKEIIKKLTLYNYKAIIASFSTKTLSGKPMNSPKRIWFEKILDKYNLNYQIKKIPNEIFYIITKTT